MLFRSYLAGHPNIVRLQDVYETEKHIFMVQELCSGGSLHSLLQTRGAIGEEAAAGLFRSIVKSVLHCHQVRARASREGTWPPSVPVPTVSTCMHWGRVFITVCVC